MIIFFFLNLETNQGGLYFSLCVSARPTKTAYIYHSWQISHCFRAVVLCM